MKLKEQLLDGHLMYHLNQSFPYFGVFVSLFMQRSAPSRWFAAGQWIRLVCWSSLKSNVMDSSILSGFSLVLQANVLFSPFKCCHKKTKRLNIIHWKGFLKGCIDPRRFPLKMIRCSKEHRLRVFHAAIMLLLGMLGPYRMLVPLCQAIPDRYKSWGPRRHHVLPLMPFHRGE